MPRDEGSILVVDDDESLTDALSGLLEHAGYTVRSAGTAAGALEEVRGHPTHLVLLDLRLGDGSGLDLLPELKSLRPEMSVVMLTALGTVENAVDAMRRGADNFIVKPLDPPSLLTVISKGLEARELRHRSLRLERLSAVVSREVYGQSAAMREAIRQVDIVAPRDATVLFLGEPGTGKDLLARRVHERSPRRGQPFVKLSCAGLQPERTESELFGHERGAFTGANERKLGLFEAADGGTLFLDEIGALAPGVQTQLLNVLEAGRLRRVGGATEIAADVRVLAATRRNLASEVERGAFREDLLHRLNVFTIPIPALRDRVEDIVPLALRFLAELSGPRGGPTGISGPARVTLREYAWPGNVRELRNVMQRAAIVCPPGIEVLPSHLPGLAA